MPGLMLPPAAQGADVQRAVDILDGTVCLPLHNFASRTKIGGNQFPSFCVWVDLVTRTAPPYPPLPFSRFIHSCMYGQRLRSSTPPFSQAFRNRPISTSTSVTPLRSTAIRDRAPSSCVFNSSRCFDWRRPLRRIIVLSLQVSDSLRFDVIHDAPPVHDLVVALSKPHARDEM